MIVFVPKEVRKGENRVAATPETVKKLIKAGHEVQFEPGCGMGAFISDEEFSAAGAKSTAADTGWAQADLILKIQAPDQRGDGKHEADLMKKGAILICSLVPQNEIETIKKLQANMVA